MTYWSEPRLSTPIETGCSKDHMRSMHKYHHRLAVWGGSLPANAKCVPAAYAPVSCKHFATQTSFSDAFWSGLKAIDLFPHPASVLYAFEPDGLKADWARVGRDLDVAIDTWVMETEEADAS